MSLTRNAYPIRLTQENGNITELMATRIDMNVTRKIGAKPVPFKGSSRFGLDMNLNQSTIVIQGFFADDTSEVNPPKQATATVNFSNSISTKNTPFVTRFNISRLFEGNLYPADNTSTEIVTIPLQNGEARSFNIKIDLSAPNNTTYFAADTSGTPFIIAYFNNLVTDTHLGSAWLAQTQQFATAFASCVNALSGSFLSATVVEGNDPKLQPRANTAVKITQSAAGVTSKNEITFRETIAANAYSTPDCGNFTGGKGTSRKSAGDKAMDMYGVLNNSKRNSTGRNILGMGMLAAGISAAVIATGGLAAAPTVAAFAGSGTAIGGAGVAGATVGLGLNLAQGLEGDYYTGLQIPYNSMIQTSDGSYVARNFMMPVGGKQKEGDTNEPFGEKGSQHNTQPANIPFDEDDYTTGIKGSIEKLDISYDAGEQIYLYNLVFKAIDLML